MTIHAAPFRLRPTALRGVPTVYIDGEISIEAKTAKLFREQLAAVGAVPELRVEINSDGGDVTEGMSMYNALRAHPARKVGVVTGIAASMASVLLLACDERRIASGALVMIHLPSGGARGTLAQIEAQAAGIRKLQAELLDIYEARTTLTREQLLAAMATDNYLTAAECIAMGLADGVETQEARVPYALAMRLARDPARQKVSEALTSRGMVLAGDAQARAAAYLDRVRKG